ncbi:MAG: hypothetical protein ACOCZK_07720 [Planctomycetota bacterium]
MSRAALDYARAMMDPTASSARTQAAFQALRQAAERQQETSP